MILPIWAKTFQNNDSTWGGGLIYRLCGAMGMLQIPLGLKPQHFLLGKTSKPFYLMLLTEFKKMR